MNWKKHGAFQQPSLSLALRNEFTFLEDGLFAQQDLYIKCLVTGPEQTFGYDFAKQDIFREAINFHAVWQ